MNKGNIIFCTVFVVIIILIVYCTYTNKVKIKEYEKLREEVKNVDELELTRYYCIKNYCKEKGFTDGFKPIGNVTDNLTVVCVNAPESIVLDTETFVLGD